MSGTDQEPLPAPIPLPGGNPEPVQRGPQQQTQQGQEPEFEIIETDSNFQPVQTRQPDQQQTDQGQQDQQQVDERGGDQDANRQPRHRSKAERREAVRQGRDRTQAELSAARGEIAMYRDEIAQLRTEVRGMEPRFTEIDQGRLQQRVADVDRQISEATRLRTEARRHFTAAMTSGDSDAIDAAFDARDQATESLARLAAEKERLSSLPPPRQQDVRPPAQQQPSAPPPLSTQAREYLSDFQADHDWLRVDPQGRPLDFDTELALRLDHAVAAEGFNPGTQEYWEELSDRIAQYMPHRAQRQQGQQQQTPRQPAQQPRQQQAPERRGPLMGGNSDRAPAANPNGNQVYLSPERKDALILAGALDRDGRTVNDAAKFKRYLTQYQAYDRANGVGMARQ